MNQTEVLSKLINWGMPMEDACAALAKLALQVIPFTAELAIESARLRQSTRAHGLPLGDRPWLELAETLGLQILTFRPAAL